MITYLIQDHEINFTRQAMNAAHQAFPREFAEWNLALASLARWMEVGGE